VWDVETGALIVSPKVVIGSPPFAAFSPDGRHLSYADGDYEVATLIIDETELVSNARERLTRELTDEECQTYLGPELCGAANP